MISSLRSRVVRKLQRRLAFLPDNRGIKFLLRLHDKLYYFTLGVIKILEKSQGGIHPKHWVTDFHNFFIDNIEPSDTVLEVGCGYGHLANAVAEKAKYVTAVEIRSEAVAKTKSQFTRDNLLFINNDFFNFPDEEKFDIVILSNILEHVKDRKRFLEKAGTLGRKLLIRVPAFDRDWLPSYKQNLGLEWRLNMDHELEYTEEVLREELSGAGLIVKQLFCKWGNYCCIAKKRESDISKSVIRQVSHGGEL